MLEIGGETLVLTHDMMVEGVHWLPGQDPADVAWKLVATNLSDLAAKGAEPVGVLLGYMLGADDLRFVEGLARGAGGISRAAAGRRHRGRRRPPQAHRPDRDRPRDPSPGARRAAARRSATRSG